MKQCEGLLERTLISAGGEGPGHTPSPQTPPPQGPLSHGLWTWVKETARFFSGFDLDPEFWKWNAEWGFDALQGSN